MTLKQELAEILLDLMHDIAKETREGTVSESEAILGIVQRREKDTDQILEAFKKRLPEKKGLTGRNFPDKGYNQAIDDMERILE